MVLKYASSFNDTLILPLFCGHGLGGMGEVRMSDTCTSRVKVAQPLVPLLAAPVRDRPGCERRIVGGAAERLAVFSLRQGTPPTRTHTLARTHAQPLPPVSSSAAPPPPAPFLTPAAVSPSAARSSSRIFPADLLLEDIFFFFF